MTAKTVAALTAEIAADAPDNTTGLITPALLRTMLQDMVDSSAQGFATGPTTVTAATYVVVAGDFSIIANRAGTVTLTLPAAASFPGRSLLIKTIQNQTVVSDASNVVPLIGGAASTPILSNTAGKWAHLISDASNWIIMAGN